MKAIKQIVATTFAIAIMAGTAVAGSGWMTDLEAGLAKGKKEGKPVLVEFTGLAWCGPCQMMEKKVFTKREFLKKASEKFILVQLDVPKKDSALRKKNQPLMRKYRVTGVPTVLLFDENGSEFHRFSAGMFPDVDKFLAHLDSALEKKDLD